MHPTSEYHLTTVTNTVYHTVSTHVFLICNISEVSQVVSSMLDYREIVIYRITAGSPMDVNIISSA